MKNFKISTLLFATVLFFSCSNDDNTPEEINEEETITTMNISLVPTGGGTAITLQSQDLDGDGPNVPQISVSGDLVANTTYSGTIELLNETETPAEDITEEVEEEGEEHQFIFVSTGSINTITATDTDASGNPIGITFSLETGAAGTSTLRVVLKHEPTKPNDGSISGSAGETEFDATFNINITI